MSIHKRMNKQGTVSYVVRYRQFGRNRARSFATKKDASAFEAQTRIAARAGSLQALDAGKQTVAAFGEQWWETHVQQNLAESTREKYAHSWNAYVLPHMGQMQLRQVTPRLIQEWRGAMERAGAQPATVKQAMNTLQACLQLAVVWGEIQTNPGREVRKPSSKRIRAVRPVTPIEVEKIRLCMLQNGQHRDATLVSVLAYTGMRPGEALALDWEHIRTNTILVERAVSYGSLKETKTSKIRSVKLMPALRHDLSEWRLRSDDVTGFIFPGSQAGKPWGREMYKSWERKIFKRAAIAAGRSDVTPYTLRHSYASLLIREGKSVVEVAAQLGHAPTMTLDTYAHVIADLDEGERLPAGEMVDQARELVLRVANENTEDIQIGQKGPNNVRKLFARDSGGDQQTA